MQIQPAGAQNFTGVVPFKVVIDGKPSTDPKNIQKAGRMLIKLLAGPTEKSDTDKFIAHKYGKADKDYNYYTGLKGYIKTKFQTASDFFRCVNDGHNWYIVTGKHAEKLKELGRNLGLARQIKNDYNLKDSFELYAAKKNYGNYLHNCLHNPNARAKLDNKPVILEIKTTSSGTYGKKSFKLKIDEINWK